MQHVQALLEPYNVMLGQAANERDDLGAKLDISRAQLWQIIVSLIGISLAGAVLSAHFLMAIRDARRRTQLLDKEKAFSELLIGSSGEGIVALDRRCPDTPKNRNHARRTRKPQTTSGGVSNVGQADKLITEGFIYRRWKMTSLSPLPPR